MQKLYRFYSLIIVLTIISFCTANLYALGDPNQGRFLDRSSLNKKQTYSSIPMIARTGDLNLYAMARNDLINNIDFLGLWTYKFITKPNGKSQYGDIVAIADKNGESLKGLAKHWAFGNDKNWKEIRKGEYRTDKKVRRSTKVLKNCEYNIFHIMPKWYRNKVGTAANGNCHYSAIAYVDQNWFEGIHKKYFWGNAGLHPDGMIIILKNMQRIKEFRGVPKNGKPGDIINHYAAKGLGHSDIYLEKDKNGTIYVFRKLLGGDKYHIAPYNNYYGNRKIQYRKK